MDVKELVSSPLLALRSHLLRLFVAMLGIVTCVALVVLIGAFPGHLDGSYKTRFDTLARSLSIYKSAPSGPQATGIQSLSDSDVQALANGLDPGLVSQVIPIAKGTAMLRYKGTQYRATVTGASPSYLDYKNTPVISGTMFTDQQYQNGDRVVLIGTSVVKALFGGDSSAALGSDIFIGRLPFRVIGLVGSNDTGNGGSATIAPMTAVRNDLLGGIRTVGEIGVVATTIDAVDPVAKQVSAILERQHTQSNGLQEDFSVDKFQSAKAAVGNQLMDALFWFAVVMAVLALLIGLVGLAGTVAGMVDDRRGEIGIRRALGARRGAIFRQFVAESTVIAGVLGIVGVVLGVVLTLVGQQVLPEVAPSYPVPELSVLAVVAAFLLSLVIGVLGGLFPATRAARTRLWDALRYWRHGC